MSYRARRIVRRVSLAVLFLAFLSIALVGTVTVGLVLLLGAAAHFLIKRLRPTKAGAVRESNIIEGEFMVIDGAGAQNRLGADQHPK